MINTIIKYITWVLALTSCSLLLAQEPATVPCTKNYYSFDYFYRSNFWLQGNNAAGLMFNNKALEPINAYTQFDGTLAYNDGPFRNIFTPASEQQYKLNAASYMKFNKIYLYGNFTYDYNFRKEVQWNGVLNPYSSPFMLADSIKGNQTLERFSLDAGIALPINKYFTAGVFMDYTVASAAKLKDLRNKNTYMNFQIRPAMLFHSDHWNLGLNFMYERTTEKIEYMQYEGSTAKTVFYLSGSWFYIEKAFSSTSGEKRQKSDDRLGGSFQVEFKTGDFKFYNEFSLSYRDAILSETGYLNQQYGDTETSDFRYDGKMSYKNKHRLTGYIATSSMLGYKVIQRYERHPVYPTIFWWITYDRLNSYLRNTVDYEVAYSFDQTRSECNNTWNLTLGMKGYSIENAYILYPLKYVQEWNYTESFISFNKNFLMKSGMLDINPNMGRGWGSGTMNDMRIMNGMTLEEIETYMPLPEEPWQLSAPLAAEFAFMTADRLNVGFRCRYTHFLNKNKGSNLYGDFRYNYSYALSDNLLKDTHRSYFTLTVGLSF